MTPLKQANQYIGKEVLKKLQDLKLKPKEILFIALYVSNNFKGTQAYIDATKVKGKERSYGAMAVRASVLLGKDRVKAGVRLILDVLLGEKKVNLDKKIIETLEKRAFYDPQMFFRADGTPAFDNWEAIPEEWRCVVDSLERKYYGKDASTSVIVMKLADKDVALDRLSKYITLYKDSTEVEHKMSDETIKKLQEVFRGEKK